MKNINISKKKSAFLILLIHLVYIGKTVLVGISVFSSTGELEGSHQYFGEIVSVDDVISIKTDEGSIQTIPPD